jgi:hypothetical protein
MTRSPTSPALRTGSANLAARAKSVEVKSGLALYLLAVVAAALAVSPARVLDDEDDSAKQHSASV